ncbi:MAG: hypothetical protein ACR2PT_20885, partial [Endozoicomonas sp.]
HLNMGSSRYLLPMDLTLSLDSTGCLEVMAWDKKQNRQTELVQVNPVEREDYLFLDWWGRMLTTRAVEMGLHFTVSKTLGGYHALFWKRRQEQLDARGEGRVLTITDGEQGEWFDIISVKPQLAATGAGMAVLSGGKTTDVALVETEPPAEAGAVVTNQQKVDVQVPLFVGIQPLVTVVDRGSQTPPPEPLQPYRFQQRPDTEGSGPESESGDSARTVESAERIGSIEDAEKRHSLIKGSENSLAGRHEQAEIDAPELGKTDLSASDEITERETATPIMRSDTDTEPDSEPEEHTGNVPVTDQPLQEPGDQQVVTHQNLQAQEGVGSGQTGLSPLTRAVSIESIPNYAPPDYGIAVATPQGQPVPVASGGWDISTGRTGQTLSFVESVFSGEGDPDAVSMSSALSEEVAFEKADVKIALKKQRIRSHFQPHNDLQGEDRKKFVQLAIEDAAASTIVADLIIRDIDERTDGSRKLPLSWGKMQSRLAEEAERLHVKPLAGPKLDLYREVYEEAIEHYKESGESATLTGAARYFVIRTTAERIAEERFRADKEAIREVNMRGGVTTRVGMALLSLLELDTEPLHDHARQLGFAIEGMRLFSALDKTRVMAFYEPVFVELAKKTTDKRRGITDFAFKSVALGSWSESKRVLEGELAEIHSRVPKAHKKKMEKKMAEALRMAEENAASIESVEEYLKAKNKEFQIELDKQQETELEAAQSRQNVENIILDFGMAHGLKEYPHSIEIIDMIKSKEQFLRPPFNLLESSVDEDVNQLMTLVKSSYRARLARYVAREKNEGSVVLDDRVLTDFLKRRQAFKQKKAVEALEARKLSDEMHVEALASIFKKRRREDMIQSGLFGETTAKEYTLMQAYYSVLESGEAVAAKNDPQAFDPKTMKSLHHSLVKFEVYSAFNLKRKVEEVRRFSEEINNVIQEMNSKQGQIRAKVKTAILPSGKKQPKTGKARKGAKKGSL